MMTVEGRLPKNWCHSTVAVGPHAAEPCVVRVVAPFQMRVIEKNGSYHYSATAPTLQMNELGNGCCSSLNTAIYLAEQHVKLWLHSRLAQFDSSPV
jgi:hypothetical protein